MREIPVVKVFKTKDGCNMSFGAVFVIVSIDMVQ